MHCVLDLGKLGVIEDIEATKGMWWMPRHLVAMKGVVSCDKPGVGANNR